MYIADLHIHSKYSRATSRDCVPEGLEFWARRKGITLLGTGDFSHPAWRAELKEKLVPAEEGLYTLREDLRRDAQVAGADLRPRFVLSGEISSIYKKNGRVRKVHNLILLPSLAAAEKLSARLEAIGNIHSDGRPILGLDSRDLLEITLEACPQAVFIPAHIWTPHFSLFGAFSGFDTIEECFEDLTPHIHALETGLSSDPPMNWRISALDRFHLVSNSDAHSPAKLGREGNLLETALSYPALARALEGGKEAGLCGTLEFFPEEGKYHWDGHRNCAVCLAPSEAAHLDGKCPVCGKRLTIGVQHRVEELADRPEGYRPADAAAFESLVPLCEVIGASTGQSASGVRVGALYESMLVKLGPEFSILRELAPEEIGQVAGPCVAEGIRRMRAGKVSRTPGFDGEYGTIQLLEQAEIDALSGQVTLFSGAVRPKKAARSAPLPKTTPQAASAAEQPHPLTAEQESGPLAGLNAEQRAAATASVRTVAVIAGPGTGKTKTLIARIAYLAEQGVKPKEITAVTFTNKAAAELRARLEAQLGKRAARAVQVGTFHAICLRLLAARGRTPVLVNEYDALELAERAVRECGASLTPRALLRTVSALKNGVSEPPAEQVQAVCARYNALLRESGAMDFDDLLLDVLADWAGENPPDAVAFRHLLVDEFQDINALQYQLIRAWSQNSGGLFVIGDPDQAIYGFRGTDAQCFARLAEELPELEAIRLTRNYRSTPEILACAIPVIGHGDAPRGLTAEREQGGRAALCTSQSELSEAIFVAKEINRMTGGIDMLDSDSQVFQTQDSQPRDFSEIAVLYRTHRQSDLLEKCLRKEGIPYVVSGREPFWGDPAVRGTLGFFRFLLDVSDRLSLYACLRYGFGCTPELAEHTAADWTRGQSGALSLERLNALALEAAAEPLNSFLRLAALFLPHAEKEPPRRLLAEWTAQRGLTDSEPVERLLNAALYHTNLPEFLETLSLGQESDLVRGERKYTSGAVRLMTLHGSKGLEFPVVFLCGVRQGVIPLAASDDLAEERRLFYVGLTRAKEELLLLTSGEPSPFLADLPADCARVTAAPPAKELPQGKQLSLF